MKLSDHIANERKQVLNREWKYLTQFERNMIFLQFFVGSVSRIAFEKLNQHIARKQVTFTRFLYPAHWL